MENEDRAEKLEEIISTLDTLFEEGEPCVCPISIQINDASLSRNEIKKGEIVSDNEYDVLRKELSVLNPNSEVLKYVTASRNISVRKIMKHSVPMCSIEKANGSLTERTKILTDWLHKCCLELGYTQDQMKNAFSQSIKRDGVAISIDYKNGKLHQAGLRPRDGINGEDVTENAKYVNGIPEQLPLPLTLTIRGELECKISTFEKIVADFENGDNSARLSGVPANPRNYTAGSIRQFDDPTTTRDRQLSFTAYGIENLENPPYTTEIDRAKWCNVVLKVPYVQTRAFDFKDLAEIEKNVDKLDYEIDGVVLSVNILEDQEQLGRHGDRPDGNPNGKLAWKFAEQEAHPTIKAIIWQTGRTGKITPVAQFDFVKLAGTKVSQCTLHNVGIVTNNALGTGAEIVVIKSGKIIPKMVGVTKKANIVKTPVICPSCGEKLELVENGDVAELFCNNKNCPAQNIGRLTHYLERIGVKGIGESKMEELISSGLVKNIADFYRLNYKDIMAKTGLKERSSVLICAQVWMLKNPEKIKDNAKLLVQMSKIKKVVIPIEKFISALGMDGAGKGVARSLVSEFNGDFDAIRKADADRLIKIDGFGPSISTSVFQFFKESEKEIDDILNYVELELPKQGKLSGKSFCFTGSVPLGKEHYYAIIEEMGGKILSSVSKKTNFCVVGQDPGAKKDKAEQLVAAGEPLVILDIDELKELLEK